MLVFQLRVIAAEKKPKKIWSIGAIQNAVGPGCSEGLARQILKNTGAGKISQKVAAVKASLKAISKFINYDSLEGLISGNDHLAKMFADYPNKIASLCKATGANAYFVIKSLEIDFNHRPLERYASGQLTIDQFVAYIFSTGDVALDSGGHLEVLHENPVKRKAHLKKLTTPQVLGILCSSPELFSTSTNHLLFDRLKKDIGNKNMPDIFAHYKLEPHRITNFIFRAINYGRFCGSKDCMFKEGDAQKMMKIMLEPIESNLYPGRYYFQLADALGKIRGMPHLFAPVRKKIESRLKELYRIAFPSGIVTTLDLKSITKSKYSVADITHIIAALQYILYKIDPETPLVSDDLKARIEKFGGNLETISGEALRKYVYGR